MNINIEDYIVSESEIDMQSKRNRYMMVLMAKDIIKEKEKRMQKIINDYFRDDEEDEEDEQDEEDEPC